MRVGTLIASNVDALRRWTSRKRRTGKRPAGLTGNALESAVMNVAAIFPEHVIHEVAA